MKREMDASRHFGSWYVIAHVPISVEKDAHNAVETYTWDAKKKRFQVEYSFNSKALDGPKVDMYQRGWVVDKKTQAEWRVNPQLPFGYLPGLRLPYLILDVADDYSWSVVGYPTRAYLWIMARTPTMDAGLYERLVKFSEDQGYDRSKIRKVPQDPGQPPFEVPKAMDLKL